MYTNLTCSSWIHFFWFISCNHIFLGYAMTTWKRGFVAPNVDKCEVVRYMRSSNEWVSEWKNTGIHYISHWVLCRSNKHYACLQCCVQILVCIGRGWSSLSAAGTSCCVRNGTQVWCEQTFSQVSARTTEKYRLPEEQTVESWKPMWVRSGRWKKKRRVDDVHEIAKSLCLSLSLFPSLPPSLSLSQKMGVKIRCERRKGGWSYKWRELTRVR